MCSGWSARWSLVLVHLLVLMMTAGLKPTLQLLRFCVSPISVTLFGRFSFLKVYGVVEVLIHEVSVCSLFASCDSQSIVCPCKLNCGWQYCPFVFKLCRSVESKIIQPLGTGHKVRGGGVGYEFFFLSTGFQWPTPE